MATHTRTAINRRRTLVVAIGLSMLGTWTMPLRPTCRAMPGLVTWSLLVKDANPAPNFAATWLTLSWTAITPASTSVQFQAAGSNSPSGPFNFVGPDGTANTFFNTSGASPSQFNGFRYLQCKRFPKHDRYKQRSVLSGVTACYSNACSFNRHQPRCRSSKWRLRRHNKPLSHADLGRQWPRWQEHQLCIGRFSVGSATTDASGRGDALER